MSKLNFKPENILIKNCRTKLKYSYDQHIKTSDDFRFWSLPPILYLSNRMYSKLGHGTDSS